MFLLLVPTGTLIVMMHHYCSAGKFIYHVFLFILCLDVLRNSSGFEGPLVGNLRGKNIDENNGIFRISFLKLQRPVMLVKGLQKKCQTHNNTFQQR